MKNINERNNFVFEFRPVTELFEEQVKLHPEKCAVVSGKESFTYAPVSYTHLDVYKRQMLGCLLGNRMLRLVHGK